ncbi:competence CoiA-like predicted nuclease [Thermolongibacillus altinsuensis]|uniref:Competence CoiA-like predicted nuclease n=1 Tax=Thermolongibacillus altinsuensis TaxID=575256 RepID=A0A4R1QQ32_9BACL|nr:competence protein CoiA family protein [Thermolongibacillus altinsuensis]TCL51005.1 competence CoiA-like predicted nuclease [Thermolongibacillus altinsuensis]
MFVALRENGERCSLLDGWTMDQLRQLRKSERFFCPVCGERVQLKLGNKRSPHFAHKKMCVVQTERESLEHLLGKEHLYTWLKRQDVDVHLEPYLPQIQQRPDLLVCTSNHLYALEYQCSPIPTALFQKRTNAYRKEGMIPIWILGSNHFRRVSTHGVKLSTFHWLFVDGSMQIPLLRFYCPMTKHFLQLTHFIPFSSSLTYATLHISPLSSCSFDDFLCSPRISFPSSFWTEWKRKKGQWRLSYPLYRNGTNEKFYAYVYAAHLSPALFPVEAGLPVAHLYWFETPAFIWQTYLLLEIMKRPLYATFSFHEIYEEMKRFIRRKMIQIRTLPLVMNSHYSYALMDYLCLLVRVRLLKRVGKTTFQRIRAVRIPNTMEEAIWLDEQIIQMLTFDQKEDFLKSRE